MPNFYVIGGANGLGKTTVSISLLPSFLDCFEYVNADAIAAGLSPFNPESMAILAGSLMLERLRILLDLGSNFAFETTLASRSTPFLRDCKIKCDTTNLIYFWLQTPELAVERVARRVASGGYSISEEVIRRTEQEAKTLHEKIDAGVKVAIAQGIERHRRLGQSITILQDGKLVTLTAEQIPAIQHQNDSNKDG